MARKRYLSSILPVLAVALTGAIYVSCQSVQPVSLTLRFHPFVGDQALLLNQVRYPNPGGEGSFKVRDFQFFVSNVRLVGNSEEFLEPESYHLARFDSEDGTYVIVIDSVPQADYGRVEFGIGVDSAANASLASVGDLDPNGRMAWNWEVGYKFVLVEGGLMLGDTQYPLVYHIGFDENYKVASFTLGDSLFDHQDPSVDFRVDLLQMFDGTETVDMAALPNVKFDRTDAGMLAGNYAGMVSKCTPPCTR
ncbi:MAG: MbnP family protein [Gemmatimonadota bacterium]